MTGSASGGILVVIEHRQGRILPISYELIACAHQFAQGAPTEIIAAILGDGIDALAQKLAGHGCQRIIAVQSPALALYSAEAYQWALAELIAEYRPSVVCVGHTSQGLDFAPGLAIRVPAACITGVERIEKKLDRLCVSRTVCGGKMRAQVQTSSETTVLTIAPNAFTPLTLYPISDCLIEHRAFATPLSRTRTLGIKGVRSTNNPLASAKTVVAAGLGICRPDAIGLIERLAALFPGAVLAGSRPVCDHEWLPYSAQVGASGSTVAPDLYFACGISGCRQHTVGMAASKFIVAICIDPEAAIFNLADIGIVDDLNVFIPIFIEEYHTARANHKW
jgi:electron transfer flavoprotein alpha subunit